MNKVLKGFSICLIAGYAMLFSVSHAKTETGIVNESIRVYAVSLDILTRQRLSADDVRRMRHSYIEYTYSSYVSFVTNELNKLKCNKIEFNSPMDVRLVIDIYDKNGVRQSYYANKEEILISATNEICPLPNSLIDALSIYPLP